MSLSAYELLAFDTYGTSGGGFLSVGPEKAYIYKDWVYVTNSKIWRKGFGYEKPVIAEIHSGYACVGNFRITTRRCSKQSAIFVHCCHTHGEDKKTMTGIGCYGYMNIEEYYIKKLKLDRNLMWLLATCSNGSEEIQSISSDDGIIETIKIPKEIQIPYEKQWIGITKRTLNEFIRFLDDLAEDSILDKDYVAKVKASINN